MTRFKKPSTGHKSYGSALNGVSLYIQNNHYELIKSKEYSQLKSKLSKLLCKFLIEKGLPIKNNGKQSSSDFNANVVQQNWKAFKEWLRSQ